LRRREKRRSAFRRFYILPIFSIRRVPPSANNGKSAKSVKKRHSRFVANVARTRFRPKSKSLSGLDQSALGATRFRVRRTFAVVRLFKTSTRFSHVNLLKYARIALPETKKTGNAGGVDRRAPNASRRRKGDGGRVRSLQKYFALHYSAETRLEKGGTLPLSLSFFLFFSKTLAAAAFQTAALLRLSLFSLF
jgi:hypothetical protein